MSHEEKSINRQRKMMFFLLAICVLGAGFTPYTRIFLGLLLGSSISFYNLWLLQTKVQEVAEAVKKDRKPKGLGTISRFAAAAFGIIIAVRFDDYFEIISFIIGLMTSYLVIVLDFMIARRTDSA
ncbi:MAG TPA: ATP synthase subunit I [Bacillota bacterium]|nr:ATP synthase subunit I [Bacillota bacterium]